MPEFKDFYPHVIDCYKLVARDNKPPHPQTDPVAREVVHSKEEVEGAKKRLRERYPGAWLVQRPMDWE